MTAKTFAELRKDATVDSVHIATALGNDKKPKKLEKSDFEVEFKVSKADPVQRMIFGWASVVEKDGKVVIDKQGDIIPIEELEKAAYDFVLNSRENDDMHTAEKTGRCIESMVFTPEKAALGITAKNASGESIYGWFTGFYIDSDPLWEAHKSGTRQEFSIGGRSLKTPV